MGVGNAFAGAISDRPMEFNGVRGRRAAPRRAIKGEWSPWPPRSAAPRDKDEIDRQTDSQTYRQGEREREREREDREKGKGQRRERERENGDKKQDIAHKPCRDNFDLAQTYRQGESSKQKYIDVYVHVSSTSCGY